MDSHEAYGLVDRLDFPVAQFFNQWVHRTWWLDQSLAFLSDNHLFKGGVLMALLWWAWFRRGSQAQARAHLTLTLLACVLALGLGRTMVNLLPHRLRPLHEPALNLATPYGVAERALNDLSSFPSDHAVLFFALAVGFFFVARWLGWLALSYVTVFIALPRLYLGLHYLSDMVVGACVGVFVCALANGMLGRAAWVQWVVCWSQRSPAAFYPLMFLLTYQIADLFEGSRLWFKGLHSLLQHVLT